MVTVHLDHQKVTNRRFQQNGRHFVLRPIPMPGFPNNSDFCFVVVNKHTSEETVHHSPVTCCVTALFALPNTSGIGQDGTNHCCHRPYTRNRETEQLEMNLSEWRRTWMYFFRKNLLYTRNIVDWYCPDDSDTKAEWLRMQTWVSHSVSGLWYLFEREKWPFQWQPASCSELRCEQVSRGDQSLSVKFSHVKYSGQCASHLVNLLTRWLLRHGSPI